MLWITRRPITGYGHEVDAGTYPEVIMVDQFGNKCPVIEIKTFFTHLHDHALKQGFQGNTNAMATAYDQKPKAKAGSKEEPMGLVRADVGFFREEVQL
ncbi:hypothetical protein DM02DRAFT_662251 [Periconia macrospinosa]|uniref:Uncharacterized protein n=1 Tax=Periconia macrospinosa TaxID=97972 RepID=A0A2V1D563_9PLEO|nr:hypothetical protein DM02DRAFT_662251 [Periconia macrospinosa]